MSLCRWNLVSWPWHCSPPVATRRSGSGSYLSTLLDSYLNNRFLMKDLKLNWFIASGAVSVTILMMKVSQKPLIWSTNLQGVTTLTYQYYTLCRSSQGGKCKWTRWLCLCMCHSHKGPGSSHWCCENNWPHHSQADRYICTQPLRHSRSRVRRGKVSSHQYLIRGKYIQWTGRRVRYPQPYV